MRIKHGVELSNLAPQMVLACLIVDKVYNQFGHEAVVTSGSEGDHSKTSRHYLGYALDFRTRYFDSEQIPAIKSRLEDALGHEYFILYEGNHFHIEYRPHNS
jgi:hypothetical protein